MARIKIVICLLLLFTMHSAASADMVVDWNNNTMDAIASGKLSPPQASRLLAMVHVAIFDAVNGINRTHHPYLVKGHAKGPASADAAVVSAAYAVLVNVVPTQNSKFYKERLASLNQIPETTSKRNGISWWV